MAFVLEDRVVETANNPGQGDFELLGATTNNRTFVAAIGNGNTTRYLAVGAEGWEIGVAQVSAGSPDRLLRPGSVTKNSNGNTTPIDFGGLVTVACIASVEDVLWLGENGDLPARGGRDLGTAGDPWRNLFLSGDATVGGTFNGNGSGLTSLNASNLSSGTLPNARLSGSYSFTSLTLSGALSAGADSSIGNFTFGNSGDSLRGPNGSASTAVFRTSGNTGTGIYFPSNSSVAITTSGTERARFDSNGITVSNGRFGPRGSSAEVRSTSSQLYLEASGNVRSETIAANTSSGVSENVYVSSSSGELFRVTSAAKYKCDVEDIDITYARAFFEGARPVWYRSTCEADPDEWSYYGYIADEVAEIDPRLVHFSDEGEPEGFAYSRVAALLHVIMKEQEARIQALELQLAALQGDGTA